MFYDIDGIIFISKSTHNFNLQISIEVNNPNCFLSIEVEFKVPLELLEMGLNKTQALYTLLYKDLKEHTVLIVLYVEYESPLQTLKYPNSNSQCLIMINWLIKQQSTPNDFTQDLSIHQASTALHILPYRILVVYFTKIIIQMFILESHITQLFIILHYCQIV